MDATDAPAQLVELSAIAAACWADKASARPIVKDVASQLGALLAAVGGPPTGDGFFVDEAASATSVDVSDSGGVATSNARDEEQSDIERMRRFATALGVAEAPVVRIGWEASAGRRGADRMEDRSIALSTDGLALAAVFDGHNGDACADYCKRHLVKALGARLESNAAAGAAAHDDAVGAAHEAMMSSFPDLHAGWMKSLGADESGCTALAALCTPTRVLVANAGDCRCVLWRTDAASGEHQLVAMNDEHTCALPAERARVEAAGASVSTTSDGKLRVGGIIQVTRCIGDAPLRHLGLTSEPEMRSVPIGPTDNALVHAPRLTHAMPISLATALVHFSHCVACVHWCAPVQVMASDGLWDVMPEARVLHCLLHTAKSPDMIAKRLLQEALDRGTDDNTSVVVVFLRDLGL